MEYKIANRMSTVSGSMIREILKLANDPSIVAFGGGNPAADAFPVDDICRISADALANKSVAMLQYGTSEGYGPLRETMKKQLAKAHGFSFENNDLIIVSGAQQAADLTTKILANEGDVIISESPSFVGCLNTFRSYGAKLVGIPMESDGMDMTALETALKENKNVRFIYTIPSFQNPTGFTTSLEKRRKMYQLAQKYDVLIFEDNPYGELRFTGADVPTIKSLDVDGRVIYGGSFSKVMAPAFRVGFMALDKGLVGRFTVAKQCTDVHTTVLFQHICNEFINTCDYDGHIARIRNIYGKKCDLMLSEMEKQLHPKVTFRRPEGGLFVMAFLPEGMDSFGFVKEGIAKGVACVPGAAFLVNTNEISNGIRLNYSSPSDEAIVKGVAILGKMTHELLGK